MPERVRRLVEKDHVYPPFGSELSEGDRQALLEPVTEELPVLLAFLRARQDGHVEVAPGASLAAGAGAEDKQDGDPGELLYRLPDVLFDGLHWSKG